MVHFVASLSTNHYIHPGATISVNMHATVTMRVCGGHPLGYTAHVLPKQRCISFLVSLCSSWQEKMECTEDFSISFFFIVGTGLQFQGA